MKIVLIIFVSLLSFNNVLPQNSIEPEPLFNLGSISVIDTSQSHFLLGYNSGQPGKKLDYALNINSTKDYGYGSSDIVIVPASKPEHKFCVPISGLGMAKMSYTSQV